MTFWPEEHITFAAGLWNSGSSASVISAALYEQFEVDRSRNAVIGVAHRHPELFLERAKSFRPQEAGGTRTRKRRARIKAARAPSSAPPSRIITLDDGFECRAVPLLQVDTFRECHWPVNDAARPDGHLFCGLPTKPGRSFCPHHLQQSIGIGTIGEQRAHKVLEAAA